MKPKILVVQRNTNVANDKLPSRSVYARLLEPLEYLVENSLIDLTVTDEYDVDLNSLNFNIVLFSKHASDRSLQIAEASKNKKIKVIYDIDDFLPAFPVYSGGKEISEKINNLKKHTQIADTVTVATNFLQSNVDDYFKIKSVLTPNGINVARHSKFIKKDDKIRIIYTNADKIKVESFKEDLFSTINTFLSSHVDIDFDIITDPNIEMNRFINHRNLGNVSWFDHKKILGENKYQIGIVPLGGYEDKESLLFNSCKSPIKYLEYSCMKIAGIYSKSPIYEKVITNFENGILVDNDRTSWLEALELLTNNHSLRNKIIENSFNDILKNHNVKNSADSWLSLFQRLI